MATLVVDPETIGRIRVQIRGCVPSTPANAFHDPSTFAASIFASPGAAIRPDAINSATRRLLGADQPVFALRGANHSIV